MKLIECKVGDLIRDKGWRNFRYITIKYIGEKISLVEYNDGKETTFTNNEEGWEYYKEPKELKCCKEPEELPEEILFPLAEGIGTAEPIGIIKIIEKINKIIAYLRSKEVK